MNKTTATLFLTGALALSLASLPAAAQDTGDDPAAEMASSAREAYEAVAAGVLMGTSTPEQVYTWSHRWMEAETARAPGVSATHAKAHLERMEALHAAVKQGVDGGLLPAAAGSAARYYLAEARATVGFATSK